MVSTRRSVLKIGSAAVVIAGAGAAAWTLTRAPNRARAPWRATGESFGDPRLDALAYAILAPNPHNMQPWRVRLDDNGGFTVFCDLQRTLPETDPPNRQITIGFGCFLELFRQAAAESGYRADFAYFPEGEAWPNLDQRPIASVTMVSDSAVARDPLFDGVLARRTNRASFDERRAVGDALLKDIIDASVAGVEAAATGDSARVAELRQLTAEAWATEWANPPTRRESINVTRIGKSEINEKPWGLSLAGPLLEALGAGPLNRDNMNISGTMAYEQSEAFYDRACRTSAAFVWSTTATNTRRDQLETGRAWVRMQMAANAAGVSFHPLSQALQEFPAMAALYKKVHALLDGGEGRTVQMLARLGYAKSPPPAPRESLTAKLISL